MITLTAELAIVKPADLDTTPTITLAADDEAWVWSDEFADAMAESAADSADLDRYCDGFLPF